jgi:NitT/TauT family transport system substrate-binding protein
VGCLFKIAIKFEIVYYFYALPYSLRTGENMRSNRLWWWLILSLAVLLIIGAVTIRYFNTPKVENKHYVVGIVTWIGYGPLFVAQEKGFFKQEGLDVEIKIMDGAGEREAAFASDRIDFFPSTPDSFVILASNNVTGKLIMPMDESNGADGLVSKKQFVKIADLKGKKVGFQSGITSHFFLLYLLSKQGLTGKDIRQQNLNAADAGSAFVAGKLDAAVTWEPWLSQVRNSPDGRVLSTSFDTPGLLTDVLMVSNKTYSSNQRDVMAFMRAWFHAVAYLQEHENECLPIIAKAFTLKPDEAKEMLKTNKLYNLEESKRYFGTIKEPGQFFEVFRLASSLYKQNGVIDAVPEVEPLIDTSLLERLKSEIK